MHWSAILMFIMRNELMSSKSISGKWAFAVSTAIWFIIIISPLTL